MKKLALLATTSVLFVCCSVHRNNVTTENNLLGTWRLDSTVNNYNLSTIQQTDLKTYTFFPNSRVSSTISGVVSKSRFVLIGNKILLYDLNTGRQVDEAIVVHINTDQLVIWSYFDKNKTLYLSKCT